MPAPKLGATTMSSRGFQDWHCHLDRAYTYEPEFFEHQGPLEGFIDASLPVKQITVGVLHRGKGYEEGPLEQRMSRVIQAKIAAGEVFLNAIVDCSPDIDGRAFRVAKKLKKKFEKKIQINVGAYPIFGFKNHGSDRELHLCELAKTADFLVGLPERDHRPGHADHSVTYEDHLSILIDLAVEHQIPLQVHVDQTNTATEDGAEKLIEAVRWKITASLPEEKRPKVWAVHNISSACYNEQRFAKLVRGHVENNVGVICCPHAAISMRQRRDTTAPVHNSIARVREFLSAGVDVRLGIDNLRDLFMPLPSSPLLMREIDILASSIRYYNESVLTKIARGEKLNETDLDSINRSLAGDYEAFGWSHTESPQNGK